MRHDLSNDKRLGLLVKPLHLFLTQDVEADSQSKALMAEQWADYGLFYVAQLLASSSPLAFLPVHIALRKNGFQPAQLSALRHSLPHITGEDENGRLAHYMVVKPSIYAALGANAALWANLESGSLVDETNKIQPANRVFSVHFEEADLEAEDIDIALAERLFEDYDFLSGLSDLMRDHAGRLKNSPRTRSS